MLVHQFITADGSKYLLDTHDRSRTVLQEDGSGTPDIDYVSKRGAYQHGETLLDFFLRPRVVQLIVLHSYCSHQKYWDGRAELLDVLRPNRGRGILRTILPNGSKRDLDCYIQQGPKFEPHGDGWTAWSYREALRFIAHDPLYYNPVQQASSATFSQQQLVFPVTFPIAFEGFDSTLALTYDGNWEEYPQIVVTGPLSSLLIHNLTTDEILQFSTDLLAGQTLTITLTYGSKTATLQDGTNWIPYVSSDSDLVTFHLQPGSNSIRVFGTGATAATRVDLTWYERYIGI